MIIVADGSIATTGEVHARPSKITTRKNAASTFSFTHIFTINRAKPAGLVQQHDKSRLRATYPYSLEHFDIIFRIRVSHTKDDFRYVPHFLELRCIQRI